MEQRRTCYNSYYPFHVLSGKQVEMLEFEPVTILYGGNGSGKSTALNIIAEKLELKRDSVFNRSSFFGDYVTMSSAEMNKPLPEASRIITSDDVFDYMLNVRQLNEGIDQKREELFDEYTDAKYADFQLKSLDDYEQLKKMNEARSRTQSAFVRQSLMANVRTHSNGENAFRCFTEKIDEAGLYILDEPENSLSPERQLELVQFLEDSARFFGCQFIISTHSPFLLSMKGAKIYNLDGNAAVVKSWTELPHVQTYYQFFKEREKEFE